MAAAVADPDPVLYYEHIALYRDPRIKQVLAGRRAGADSDRQGGAAARRRRPGDRSRTAPTCTTACASPRRSPATASRPRCSTCAALAPLDRDAVLAVARHCGRVLIVHEDSRTGGIGESLAAIIQEEAFEWLDAPVRVARRARHAGAVLAAARGAVSGRARPKSSARRGCSSPTDCGPVRRRRLLGALAGERGGALAEVQSPLMSSPLTIAVAVMVIAPLGPE